MLSIEPILFFLIFGLLTVIVVILARLWDISEEIDDLKEKLRHLKGEPPEFTPEWF